ncbi:MAG: 30S ribosomal protein S16 [Chloroflexi bacterium]|nr:30S ribosomal protein S16 [Chloroflexota bacterium]
MPVKIRLRRMGATKQPSYRLVVADSRAPRDGAFIETIGHYNPLTKPATIKVDEERVRYWIEHGAQPTESVVRILKRISLDEKLPKLKDYEKAIKSAPQPAAETEESEG